MHPNPSATPRAPVAIAKKKTNGTISKPMIFKFFLLNVKSQLAVRHSAGPACSEFLFWVLEYLIAFIGHYFMSLTCEI